MRDQVEIRQGTFSKRSSTSEGEAQDSLSTRESDRSPRVTQLSPSCLAKPHADPACQDPIHHSSLSLIPSANAPPAEGGTT